TRTDYELRGEESGSGRRIRQGQERAGKAFWRPRRHAGHRKEYVTDEHVAGRAGRDSTRSLAHRAHRYAIIRRHGERGRQGPHGDAAPGNDTAPTIHGSLSITRTSRSAIPPRPGRLGRGDGRKPPECSQCYPDDVVSRGEPRVLLDRPKGAPADRDGVGHDAPVVA